MSKTENGLVVKANTELQKELAEPSVMQELMRTTFKGFQSEKLVKQACLEAMVNGYTFQDILKKRVYAIPYGDGYSLVQSIKDVRIIAMESGQIGASAPVYVDDENGRCVTCTVTIKRLLNGHVGDYTATVYFNEYNKPGKNKPNNWDNMPRTMIAKVAEMHALRKAFPEKFEGAYIEEEMMKPAESVEKLKIEKVDTKKALETLNKAKDLEDLKKKFRSLPREEQGANEVRKLKDKLKKKFTIKADSELVDDLDKK